MATKLIFPMRAISKRLGRLISAVTLVAFLVTSGACSKQVPAPKGGLDTKEFDSASPELKAAWQTVVTAASSNDYAKAISTCRKLQAQGQMSPEQNQAIADTSTALYNQVTAAATKGDEKAIQAIADLRKQWR